MWAEGDISNDNGCLSWQETRRGQGKKTSKIAGTTSPKKNKLQITQSRSKINTRNRFESLSQEEIQQLAPSVNREPSPPPILIRRIINIKSLTQLLENVITSDHYTLMANNDAIKVMSLKLPSHKISIKLLHKCARVHIRTRIHYARKREFNIIFENYSLHFNDYKFLL